jgi:hypothetical protein
MGRSAGQEVTDTRTWKVTATSGHSVSVETPADIDVLEIKYDMERKLLRVIFSSDDFVHWNNAKVESTQPTNP